MRVDGNDLLAVSRRDRGAPASARRGRRGADAASRRHLPRRGPLDLRRPARLPRPPSSSSPGRRRTRSCACAATSRRRGALDERRGRASSRDEVREELQRALARGGGVRAGRRSRPCSRTSTPSRPGTCASSSRSSRRRSRPTRASRTRATPTPEARGSHAADEHHPGGQRRAAPRDARATRASSCSARTSASSAACSAPRSGLYDEFGADRVIDTPLAEGGIIGTAIGMALYGLRPVPGDPVRRLHLPGVRSDRERAGEVPLPLGRRSTPCPMVIRTPVGGGIRGGHYHSQSPEALFIHTPGLKVVVPVEPVRREGPAARGDPRPDPVLFFEPKRIYRAAQGRGARGRLHGAARQGERSRARARSVTLVAWGAMCARGRRRPRARRRRQGIDVRGHRPAHAAGRSTSTRSLASVKKTGRVRGRARGAAHLRLRRRARRARSRSGFLHLEAPTDARDRLRHAVPVHARERVPAARAPHPAGASARSSPY